MGTTTPSRPLPVLLGRARLTQGGGPTTGDAGASLTHREVLVADAAHGEAVVAGVHSPGQHLVQVHVGASVQQLTPRPVHPRGQRRLPSLLPSGAAAALGRRPRQRRAPEAGGAQLGPAAHPEPWRARPGGGGPVRGRSAALVGAPVTARAGPGEARGSTQQPQPRPSNRPGGPRCPHTSSGRWVADPDRARVVQAARARPGRLTCSFLARVPATPTGLGHTLRVARSFRPKYREISRGKLEYCGRGLTFFYHSTV